MPPKTTRPNLLANLLDEWHELKASHAWARARLGQYLRSHRFWLGLGAAVLLTGFVGPFDTYSILPLARRLGFWASAVAPAVLLQFHLSMTLREYARRRRIPWGYPALAAGVLGAGPILALVNLLHALIIPPAAAIDLPVRVTATITLVIALTVLVNAFMPTLQPLWGMPRRRPIRPPASEASASGPPAGPQIAPAPAAEPAAANAPPAETTAPAPLRRPEPSILFGRIPDELGREIICLRAANHHIEITTPKGQARLLMRLSDAEAELANLPGLRVHRSWWVNMAHVTQSVPRQGSLELILTTGQRVPVSRAMRNEVQAWLARDAAQ